MGIFTPYLRSTHSHAAWKLPRGIRAQERQNRTLRSVPTCPSRCQERSSGTRKACNWRAAEHAVMKRKRKRKSIGSSGAHFGAISFYVTGRERAKVCQRGRAADLSHKSLDAVTYKVAHLEHQWGRHLLLHIVMLECEEQAKVKVTAMMTVFKNM